MASNEAPLIQLSHVGVSFGRTVVHREISLEVYPGEVVTLLGPSGAGKTVILKLMIGLLFPTRGKVYVEGQDLATLSAAELRELRRDIGMLFQGAALFDSLTVADNIAYAPREFGERDEMSLAKLVSEKLALIGLSGIEQKYPSQLSGGQKKRVGLARALATEPKVMLFDEPTTGLDPTARNRIDDLIVELRDDLGITSVVITHDMESAHRISDRLVLINEGVIVVRGPASELWDSNEDVRRFAEGRWGEEAA
jgi:phospholipid/cholesterol/gamma-HCH transport system ATP-binding protein